MSRKSLIICLAVLAVMIVGIGISVAVLYSGTDNSKDKEMTKVAVILVSSELPEVLGMSDRITVVHEGRITGTLTAEEADQAMVMTLATGGNV